PSATGEATARSVPAAGTAPAATEAAPARAPGETEASPDTAPEIDPFPGEILAELATRGDLPYRGLSDEERITLRVRRWATEALARDRVQAGIVDPYFGALRERFGRHFEPDWGTLDPALSGKSVVAALTRWAKDWQGTAQRYGEKGTPYFEGEQPSGLGDTLPQPYTGGDPTLAQLDQMHTVWRDWAAGRIGGIELDALVRVVQAPDGTLLEVEVVRSSGKPRYDQLAVEAVREALAEPLVPERQGKGVGLGGAQIVSLWKFRTRFSVVPPAVALPGMAGGIAVTPMAGVDETGDLKYPLEPVVKPQVELVAVF
ncbi:MAG: TonB family protein, partial [Deltaproteobacteria bacterium]